ncbi:MAG: coiled-coil protein [Candidatus Woesearchaeota archaeon]
MLNQAEINNLLSELNSVRSEVRDLKNKINSLDRRKEEMYREKRKISSDIHSRIRVAKDSKDKRNSLTDAVKNTKHSKEELEARLKTLDEEIRTLKEEKHKLLEKIGVEDPIMLKKNIKKLEFRIETEGLTFEKEKELMKVLSKMKKQYDSSKVIVDIETKLSSKFRELRELREMMDMTKKIVQVSAKESQKHHVELIESSKEIDELKKKEDTFESEGSKYKAEIAKLNEELNVKLTQLDEIRKVLGENNVKLKEDIEKSNNEILKQKDHEVQEKIKTGKKLTTEDLLILQRTMKN